MSTTSATTGRLDTGVVSRSARRRTAWLLAAAALAWHLPPAIRLLRTDRAPLAAAVEAVVPIPYTQEGFGIREFLTSPEIAWVGSPLYLGAVAIDAAFGARGVMLLLLQLALAVALVVAVFRVGERWVGHRAAVLAALLCAASATGLAASGEVGPALAVSVGCLLLAGALSRVHPRGEARVALRLGMSSGLLATLSGLGVLWAAVVATWLPTRGRGFRGVRYLVALAYLLAGVLALAAPVLLRNALTQHDLVAPWSNAPFDLYTGVTQRQIFPARDLAHAEDPLARRQYALLVLARQRPQAATRDAARAWEWTRLAVGGAVTRPLEMLGAATGRVVAFLGGEHPESTAAAAGSGVRRGLPTVPLGAITALAWLGFFALVGSLRAYAPLYACAALPLLCATATGVAPAWQLVALPAHCLFAGYGVVRIVEARRTPSTWPMALALLAMGAAVAFWG